MTQSSVASNTISAHKRTTASIAIRSLKSQHNTTMANHPLHEFTTTFWSGFDITIVRDDAASGDFGYECDESFRLQVNRKSKEVVAREQIRLSRERWHTSIDQLPLPESSPTRSMLAAARTKTQFDTQRTAPRLPQRQNSFSGISESSQEKETYHGTTATEAADTVPRKCPVRQASFATILSATTA